MSDDSSQGGEEPSSMERLREKAEKLLERLSWPIRTSLACFMASMIAMEISNVVDLHDTMITARVFAPIAAALCSASTFGASIQTSCLVLLGSVLGGIIGFPVGLGANLFPGAHVVALAISAFCILIPSMEPVFIKIVLIIITVSVTYAADPKTDHDQWQPVVLVVCAAFGALCPLVVNLLPLPGRRAIKIAEMHTKESEECLEAAIVCLTRAFGVGRDHKMVLINHAEFLLHLGQAALGNAKKLLGEVDWEDSFEQAASSVLCCCTGLGGGGSSLEQTESRGGMGRESGSDRDSKRRMMEPERKNGGARARLAERLECLASVVEAVSGFRLGLLSTLQGHQPRKIRNKLRKKFYLSPERGPGTTKRWKQEAEDGQKKAREESEEGGGRGGSEAEGGGVVGGEGKRGGEGGGGSGKRGRGSGEGVRWRDSEEPLCGDGVSAAGISGESSSPPAQSLSRPPLALPASISDHCAAPPHQCALEASGLGAPAALPSREPSRAPSLAASPRVRLEIELESDAPGPLPLDGRGRAGRDEAESEQRDAGEGGAGRRSLRRSDSVSDLLTLEQEQEAGFDMCMAGVVHLVGERIAACIRARGARYRAELGEELAEQAEAALREGLAEFCDATSDTREALWYRPDRQQSQRQAEAFKAWGPPVARLHMLWSLQDCALRLLPPHPATPATPEVEREGRGREEERCGGAGGTENEKEEAEENTEREKATAQEEEQSKKEAGWAWGMLMRLRGMVRGAAAASASASASASVWEGWRKRLTYSAKVTLALVLAVVGGERLSGSGLWAGAVVCFIGPRVFESAGGSYRLAAQRVTGTVAGAVAASTLLAGLYPADINVTHHLLLALWVLLCSLFRSNPAAAYGVLVAIMTPYICVLASAAPPPSLETWVFQRIQQNVVGVLAFTVVELLIWPSHATTSLRSHLADTLRQCGGALELMLARPGLCGECAGLAGAGAGAALRSLFSALASTSALLDEAAADPAWLLLAAFPMPKIRSLLEEGLGELCTLLALIHRITLHCAPSLPSTLLQASDTPPLRPLQGVEFVGPLRRPLAKVQARTCALLAALARELNLPTALAPSADLAAESATAYAALKGALAILKLRYQEHCAGLVLGRMPPSEHVLPLTALIFSIDRVAATLREVMGSVRQLSVVLRSGFAIDAVKQVERHYLRQTAARLEGFVSQSALSSGRQLSASTADLALHDDDDDDDDDAEEQAERGACSRCGGQVRVILHLQDDDVVEGSHAGGFDDRG